MNVTKRAVENLSAVMVLTVFLSLFGFIAMSSLPLQLLPEMSQPKIVVSSSWRGAAPQEIEEIIIKPQEDALKLLTGVEEINTTVVAGTGTITMHLRHETDINKALINVVNALNQIPPKPLDADEPVITSGGGGAVLSLASVLIRTEEGNPATDFSDYQHIIEGIVEPRLKQISGIAEVHLGNKIDEEVHITLDPVRMATLSLTVEDVRDAVVRATNISAGDASVDKRNFIVRYTGRYDLTNINNLIIKNHQGRMVYLRDVATAGIALPETKYLAKRDGYPAYYITLDRVTGSNTVAILDQINLAVEELNSQHLSQMGLKMELSFDASVHIRRAISLISTNLALGIFLAIVVLYGFFRGIRQTLFISLAIPFSIITSFIALSLFSRTLNIVSLAGIAFATGMVLDAAIVVQEAINRYRCRGLGLLEAVYHASDDVKGALLASTLTTVFVFIPIVFIRGVEGQLFTDLSITISVSVGTSFFTALVIIPIANVLLESKEKSLEQKVSPLWQQLGYLACGLTDSRVKSVVWSLALTLGAALLMIKLLPKPDFLPRAKADGIYMNLSMPSGINLESIEKEVAAVVAERLKPHLTHEKAPFIRAYNLGMDNNAIEGFFYPQSVDDVDKIIALLKNNILTDLPDVDPFVTRGTLLSVNFNGGNNIRLDLQGSHMSALLDAAEVGMMLLKEALPGISIRSTSNTMQQPTLMISPKDVNLYEVGLRRDELGEFVKIYNDGLFLGEYFDGNDRLDIFLKGQPWNYLEDLHSLPIYTPNAKVQYLGDLAEIKTEIGPTQLKRVDGQRTVSLSVIPSATMSLDDALNTIKTQVMPKLRESIDEEITVKYKGSADKLKQGLADIAKMMLFALFILFFTVSIIFKSIRDSFIVLLSLPLTMMGGVVMLKLENLFVYQSFDLLTMIGFIILVGIVVNNAILLVDQIRTEQRSGKPESQAILNALQIRFRPIVMTTLTSIFGMLPLMLSPGAGSEIYRGLATVIVGGMLSSLIFTIILIPALLQTFDSFLPNSSVKN